ncbi:hypothetical protein KA517_00105 [Candidatus Gracilibacteria bacterium]|nr:hypothetical protein [Candidatus Gracilibacteria bacterium]
MIGQIEIEERYLASDIDLPLLVGDAHADHAVTYANFIFDYFEGSQQTVRLRSQSNSLRARLYDASVADVRMVIGVPPEQRLAKLLTIVGRRKLQFTLKLDHEGVGRHEIEEVNEIAKYFGQPVAEKSIANAEFMALLESQSLFIFGSILTDRKQWSLPDLDGQFPMAITSDWSRCHHDILGNEQGRKIVEIEALVSGKDAKTKSPAVKALLLNWMKPKLMKPDADTVVGGSTLCTARHTPLLMKQLVAATVIKPKVIKKMVAQGELSQSVADQILS